MKTLLAKALYAGTVGLIIAPFKVTAVTLDVTGNALITTGVALKTGGVILDTSAENIKGKAKARVMSAQQAKMEKIARAAIAASGVTIPAGADLSGLMAAAQSLAQMQATVGFEADPGFIERPPVSGGALA